MKIIQPKGPYYIAGYSFGGLVAYEMAQQLSQDRETIGFLGLVDATTSRSTVKLLTKNIKQDQPSTTIIKEGNHRAIPATQLFSNLSSKFFWGIKWRLGKFNNTLRVQRKNFICYIFLGLGYLIPSSQRRDYCMRIVVKAAKQYRPKKYSGEIIIFQTNSYMESYWRKLCCKVNEVYSFSAKHLEITKEPNTQLLLLKLMNSLQTAQKNISQKHNE